MSSLISSCAVDSVLLFLNLKMLTVTLAPYQTLLSFLPCSHSILPVRTYGLPHSLGIDCSDHSHFSRGPICAKGH